MDDGGDMFDNALKAGSMRVQRAGPKQLRNTTVFPLDHECPGRLTRPKWWRPTSASERAERSRTRRLPSSRVPAAGHPIHGVKKIRRCVTRLFDTGSHHIGGVQKQQGGGLRLGETHSPDRHLRGIQLSDSW